MNITKGYMMKWEAYKSTFTETQESMNRSEGRMNVLWEYSRVISLANRLAKVRELSHELQKNDPGSVQMT